VVWR